MMRNKDAYETKLYDFVREDILVVCASCSGKAIVKKPGTAIRHLNAHEVKLVCTNCGYNKRLSETPVTGKYSRISVFGARIDPYFHQDLWLSDECDGNILWAYNHAHLDFLEKHVEAGLRERNIENMQNSSLGSRLPKWMTSRKNRELVLKAITKLRAK